MKTKKQFNYGLSFVLVSSLFFFFQNCSKVSFKEGQLKSSSLGEEDVQNPEDPTVPGGPTFSYKQMNQTVDVRATNDVDILFVVDNSGSMKQEQQGLANKISGFMNIIKDLNWQIALTTTDPSDGVRVRDDNGIRRAWGDGQFRPFDADDGSQFILSSTTESLQSAQNKLAFAINVGITGSGNERGINSTYRALERSSESSSIQSQFFRENSKLVVVLISDEDECSQGNCSESSSGPQNLISFISSKFGNEKVFKFNSIVKAPSDSSCNTAAHTANTYALLSQLTGGAIGSICATDYTSILTDMGQRVKELVKSANLDCEPVDANGDGRVDVVLTLSSGQQLTSGFNLQGPTITFDQSLPEGLHHISYTCIQIE